MLDESLVRKGASRRPDRRVWRMFAVLACFLALVGTACSSSDEDGQKAADDNGSATGDSNGGDGGSDSDAALAALVSDAKAEDCLSVYTSIDNTSIESLLDAFDDEYGIRGTYTRDDSVALTERMNAEFDQNSSTWDATIHSVAEDIDALHADDRLAPLSSLLDWDEWPEHAKLGDYAAGVGYHLYVLAWNTDLVTDADAPETPEDLTEFAGKIGGPDPKSSLNFAWMYLVADQAAGGHLLSDLSDADFKVLDGWAHQQIAAGELTAGFAAQGLVVDLQEQGAPIDYRVLSPATGAARFAALSKTGRCTAAGQLFVNFLMTRKGQEILNHNLTSALDDVPGTVVLPSDYELLDSEAAAAEVDRIATDLRG